MVRVIAQNAGLLFHIRLVRFSFGKATCPSSFSTVRCGYPCHRPITFSSGSKSLQVPTQRQHPHEDQGCYIFQYRAPWRPGDQYYLWRYRIVRSEEHTSELQSRGHLVCRLLLEKKKDQETR